MPYPRISDFIVDSYARLIRWDRSGVIFTGQIFYDTQPELVVFFECYNPASSEVRSSDKDVGKPTSGEITAALQACPSFCENLLAQSAMKISV
jgi:hypothetical protein